MSSFASFDNIIGQPQIQFNGLSIDTAPKMQPGAFLRLVDNYWGAGEYIYARASASIRVFGLCTLTPVFDATLNSYRFDAVEIPNTANLGRGVVVSVNALAVGQYSWFCKAGLTPMNCQASVAADTTLGIAAAGQGGANTAGKQLLNARVIAAATTTVVKANATGVNGTNLITVLNGDGWFVGGYLSGTGVGAAAIITAISPDGRSVTVSVANSAAVSGSVTCTYNNATIFYNVVHLDRAIAQGAIT